MRSKLKRMLAGFLAVFMFMVAMAPCALADDEEGPDASFYKAASVASAYLSTLLSNDEALPAGMASGAGGGLLGYSDEADTSGLVSGWISSALSASSAPFDYQTLKGLDVEGASVTGAGDTRDALWLYAQYGRLLREAGFDDTGSESGITQFVRGIGGTLVEFAYYVADSVSSLFSAIIRVLKILNPFAFLKPSHANGLVLRRELPDGSTRDYGYIVDGGSDPDVDVSQLKPLAEYLGAMYDALIEFQPYIIGGAFIIMATTILFTKKSISEGKGQIRRFITRVCALVLVIPICGSMYTVMLDDLAVDFAEGGPQDQKVLETFVDFEWWAKQHGLKPSITLRDGKGATLKATVSTKDGSMTVDKAVELNARGVAYNINTYGSLRTAEALHARALDMVKRYSSAAFYYSSAYEGFAKSHSNFTYKDQFSKVVEKAADAGTFKDNAGLLLTATIEDVNAITNVFSTNVRDPGSNAMPHVVGSIGHRDGSTVTYDGNTMLSTMSVYNYLTSSFDDTSVTVYSNEKAPSGFVRQSHFSVVMVGTGFNSFLYWVDCVVSLIVMGLIGWIFALSLIMNVIKRFIHLATTIPFAMLGSLKSIARIVIYTIMLFAEIAVTILVYRLLMEIMQGIPGLIMTTFATLLGNDSGTVVSGLSTVASPAPTTILAGAPSAAVPAMTAGAVIVVVLLLNIAFQIMFVTTALKTRKSVVKFIDEMVTELVEKLLGVKAAPDGGSSSGMGGKMAAAAAAGAGAGLAQHKLAKSEDSGSNKEQSDTKGIASDGGDKDGKTGGSGGDGKPLPPGGGNDAPVLAGDNATTVEGGDTNISDDDSPVLNQDGDDEQSEMEAANSMESLADGDEAKALAEAGEDGAPGDGEDGEAALPEAGDDAQAEADAEAQADDAEAAALEAGDEARDDAENAQEDAAEAGMEHADTAEEVADEAAGAVAAGDSAESGRPVDGAKAVAGGKDISGAKPGQQSVDGKKAADGKKAMDGKKPAQAMAAGDSRTDAKGGAKDDRKGVAAAGQQGKDALSGKADGKDAKATAIGTGDAKGNKPVQGQEAKPALAGGASGSVAEAKSRRDAAAARLAALQAANGQAPEQGGNAAVSAGGQGKALPADGAKPQAVAAGQQDKEAMPGGQPVNAAMPTSDGQKAVSGQQGKAAAMPAGSPAGSIQGQGSPTAVPVAGGRPGKAVAGPGGQPQATPIAAAGREPMPAGGPSGTAPVMNGTTGQPAMSSPKGADAGKAVSATGGKAAPVPAQSGGGQTAVPVERQAPLPAGASTQVQVGAKVTRESGQVVAGSVQDGKVQFAASRQESSSVETGMKVSRQDGPAAPVQGAPQAPMGAKGAGIRESSSVESTRRETHTSSDSLSVKSEGPAKVTHRKTTVKGQPTGAGTPAQSGKQPSVAGAAAQAAMAAFLASSDNPVVSGMGQGALMYQQMDRMSRMQGVRRGTAMVGETVTEETVVEMDGPGEVSMGHMERSTSEESLIASYDAETAQIEAKIAELEKAQGMRRGTGTKSLGKARPKPDDADFVEG